MVAIVLAVLCVACAKTTDEWIVDLDSADPFARQMAAVALGAIPPAEAERAVRALARHLEDPEPAVFDALLVSLDATAAHALQALVEEVQPENIPYELRREQVRELLARRRAESFGHLCALLRRPGAFDPRRVLSLLRPLRPGELAGLCAVLDDPDPRVRRGVVWVIGNLVLDPTTLADALAASVADPDAGVRRTAAETLGRICGNSPPCLAALEPLCDDPVPAVRAIALAPIVLHALESEHAVDAAHSERARTILANLDGGDVDALIIGLGNSTVRCAWQSMHALRKLGEDTGSRPGELLGRQLDGETSFEVLAAHLSADAGSDELRRARAALALGHGPRRDERAVPLLARALSSERTPVRTCAALSLLRFGAAARPALAELQALRQDDQAIVRELVEYVLAQPGLR